MITRVEACRYRCLRYANHGLNKFNVLVGPNASGKTTFLDAIAFLGDVVRDGPSEAVGKRTENMQDLLWQGRGASMEIAAEFSIPAEISENLPEDKYDTVRYEIQYGFLDDSHSEHGLIGERVWLKYAAPLVPRQRELAFPDPQKERSVYNPGRTGRDVKSVIHKVRDRNDTFYSEMTPNKGKGWIPSFKFGAHKSALANLPDDGTRFPVSTWLKQFLSQDVQDIVLNSRVIRKSSPPGLSRHFLPDGSNLPWVVDHLRNENPSAFNDWLAHVQVAFPDIEGIEVREREDTKYRHIAVIYTGGVEIPSWMVSDGTLRFLALTLLAYLPNFRGTYLIEEPENGIHPRAIEHLLESLSSIHRGQLLMATHSPIAVGLINLENLLCFAKLDGATDIVIGSDHPALLEWRQQKDGSLGWIFSSGILG